MATTADPICIRMKPSVKATGWFAVIVFGAASIGASVSALVSSSPDESFDGCVGGVGFGAFTLLGVLVLAMASRHAVIVGADSIERRDLFRIRKMQFADLVLVIWRHPPRSGKIVLSDGAYRVPIGLYDYCPADRAAIVGALRDLIPDRVEQTGWDADVFRRKPQIRSSAELKRLVRFTIFASCCGWLGSMAIAAWSIQLGEPMPPLWSLALKGIPLWGMLPLLIALIGWIESLDQREIEAEPSSSAPDARAAGDARQ